LPPGRRTGAVCTGTAAPLRSPLPGCPLAIVEHCRPALRPAARTAGATRCSGADSDAPHAASVPARPPHRAASLEVGPVAAKFPSFARPLNLAVTPPRLLLGWHIPPRQRSMRDGFPCVRTLRVSPLSPPSPLPLPGQRQVRMSTRAIPPPRGHVPGHCSRARSARHRRYFCGQSQS
jgi:hypothetical protein